MHGWRLAQEYPMKSINNLSPNCMVDRGWDIKGEGDKHLLYALVGACQCINIVITDGYYSKGGLLTISCASLIIIRTWGIPFQFFDKSEGLAVYPL